MSFRFSNRCQSVHDRLLCFEDLEEFRFSELVWVSCRSPHSRRTSVVKGNGGSGCSQSVYPGFSSDGCIRRGPLLEARGFWLRFESLTWPLCRRGTRPHSLVEIEGCDKRFVCRNRFIGFWIPLVTNRVFLKSLCSRDSSYQRVVIILDSVTQGSS